MSNEDETTQRPSIADIEAILEQEENVEIEILPNGEVRVRGESSESKPLTMRESLGGEYGISDAVDKARANWQAKHGKCSLCAAGDKPQDGIHRHQHYGQHPCGNEQACMICAGVLPSGEQCQACGRINKRSVAC